MRKLFPGENSWTHIETLVTAFAYKTFGGKFSFRPGQKEQCVSIIQHFLTREVPEDVEDNDKESNTIQRRYVLQAPTGSGKSIIAMIVAGVLSEDFNMTGYILVSDLGLLDQYIRDVEKYCKDWGHIKGKGSYICPMNGRDYNSGMCSMKDDDWAEEYGCKSICPYCYDRNRAMSAQVVVCTYHHWLIHKRLNQVRFGKQDCEKNEFVIADETHNAMKIVQDMFSLSVGESYVKHADAIDKLDNYFSVYANKRRMSQCVSGLISACVTSDHAIMYRKIEALKNFVDDIYNKLKDFAGDEKRRKSLTSEYYKELSWVRNRKESLDTYVKAIKGRVENVIVTLSDNKENAILNSTDESYLMREYFHSHYLYGLFMSATIGDSEEFCRDLSMDDIFTKTFDMPSSFDFTNSKIYYNQAYSLSKATLETNLPYVGRMADAIMNIYSGFRGCIFVSSYELGEKLVSYMSPQNRKRIIVYRDSREKASALLQLRGTPNGVLIGPSIFEGISLDDDMCRFSIIAKVPYADVSNKLTKYKLQTFGFRRYALSAIQNIIQAVGRGVRSERDWCTTFVIDGAFGNLYRDNEKAFGPIFKSRMVPFSLSQLGI